MIATMEPGMIGLMEPLLDSRIDPLRGRVSSFPSSTPFFVFFMVVVAFFIASLILTLSRQ